MALALIGAGILVALALVAWVLKTAHSRPSTARGHAHNPLQRVVLRVLTRLITTSLRAGIRFGPMTMLTLPGRKSGLPRTNPVDLWTGDGRSFLVATHTEHAAWVHNLRAAGGGMLWLGRRPRRSFTAIELPLHDAAAVLKSVLGPRMRKPVAGFVLRQTVAVPPDAPMSAFLEVAKTHPVFEVTLTPLSSPGADPHAPATRRRPIVGILIAAGLLTAIMHGVFGLLDTLGPGQWISGVVIGLLIAGIGNHIRIFGRLDAG